MKGPVQVGRHARAAGVTGKRQKQAPPRGRPRAMISVGAAAVVAGAIVLLAAGPAEAYKRRFEPTDLELEEPGTLEADVQMGFLQSDGPGRLVLPDAEIDLGLAAGVELDIDFTFGLEGPARGRYNVDHTTTDNTWLAAKLGLFDFRDPRTGNA